MTVTTVKKNMSKTALEALVRSMVSTLSASTLAGIEAAHLASFPRATDRDLGDLRAAWGAARGEGGQPSKWALQRVAHTLVAEAHRANRAN